MAGWWNSKRKNKMKTKRHSNAAKDVHYIAVKALKLLLTWFT